MSIKLSDVPTIMQTKYFLQAFIYKDKLMADWHE